MREVSGLDPCCLKGWQVRRTKGFDHPSGDSFKFPLNKGILIKDISEPKWKITSTTQFRGHKYETLTLNI